MYRDKIWRPRYRVEIVGEKNGFPHIETLHNQYLYKLIGGNMNAAEDKIMIDKSKLLV